MEMAATHAAPREKRGQTAHVASEEQARTMRARREEIIEEIKRMRGSYGQKNAGTPRSVPYAAIEKLFDKVEEWARHERVIDASERVETAARRIEEAAGKLEKQEGVIRGNATYAQVASSGIAGTHQGRSGHLGQAPAASPREEKRIIVRIPDDTQTKTVGEQSREEIMARIKGGAGEEQGTSEVIAVRKLKSGDLAIHVNSPRAKKEMEETTDWAKRIAPAAVVQKRTWPVLVHGVRVADYPRSAGEKNARRIETENNRLHPGLKIKDVRWLGYVEGEKEYASLILRVDSASQANRLIKEGVVMRYDLKNAETYDPKCRVTQCFKCQQYGHISPECMSQQRCGFCGGQHVTEQCAERSQATNKRCAACKVGDHASWSQACPAKQREIARAKQAERFKPKLFPVSSPMAFTFNGENEATQATSMRGANATAEGEWTMVDKKRRLNTPGRPVGALNRAKTIQLRPEDRSILSFTQSTINSSLGIPSSQAESTFEESQMNTEL